MLIFGSKPQSVPTETAPTKSRSDQWEGVKESRLVADAQKHVKELALKEQAEELLKQAEERVREFLTWVQRSFNTGEVSVTPNTLYKNKGLTFHVPFAGEDSKADGNGDGMGSITVLSVSPPPWKWGHEGGAAATLEITVRGFFEFPSHKGEEITCTRVEELDLLFNKIIQAIASAEFSYNTGVQLQYVEKVTAEAK